MVKYYAESAIKSGLEVCAKFFERWSRGNVEECKFFVILLALSLGHRLHINFFVSKSKFPNHFVFTLGC